MTSEPSAGSNTSQVPTRAYVWAWQPGATSPVVAGVVGGVGAVLDGEPVLAFRYAASYLARPTAISLFTPSSR